MLSKPREVIDSDIFIPIVDSLRNISEKITELYPDPQDTLFLFIGASPAYLYYYFKNCFPHYESVLFPISGLNSLYHGITYEIQCDFDRYSRLFFDKYKYKKIVIIDHSHTGKSISNLYRLISHRDAYDYKFDKTPTLEFVDLIDYRMSPESVLWIREVTHVIQGNYIHETAGHIFPRLTPQIHLGELKDKNIEDFLRDKKSEIEHDLSVLGEMKKYF